jgi:hypothetical protein
MLDHSRPQTHYVLLLVELSTETPPAGKRPDETCGLHSPLTSQGVFFGRYGEIKCHR